MKKIIFILMVLIVFLTGCSTSNEITNKTYDVEININNISEAFIPAAEKAIQSSVGISCYVKGSVFGSWQLESVGSGVVYFGQAVLKEGTILDNIEETKNRDDVDHYLYRAITNYHVINKSGNEVMNKVYLSKLDLLIDCTVLGYNIYEDLAVVEFETTVFIPLITFGNSDNLQSGELVLAVGNPEGYDYSDSVTLGIIGNPQRYVEVERDLNGDGRNDWTGTCEYLQHNAAINSGNSGGALVNIKGELIGINAMKLIDKNNTIEGMGFAIPIKIVNKYLADLEKGKNIQIKQLKGSVYSINEILNQEIFNNVPKITIPLNFDKEYGVYVYSLDDFGLKDDDIIIELNGYNIYNRDILNETIRNDVDDTFIWVIYRDGKYQEIIYQEKE